jgi:glutamyl-tRNA reductase
MAAIMRKYLAIPQAIVTRTDTMSFTVIGISHHQTALDIRGRFYCSFENCEFLLQQWSKKFPNASFLILCTCNRLEFYTDLYEKSTEFQTCLQELIAEPEVFLSEAYLFKGADCISHLFKVSCGLDSKIIGENQIIGQIKQAFLLSKKYNCLKHRFQRLFEQAFYWSKQLKSIFIKKGLSSRSWGKIAAQWLSALPPAANGRSLLFIGAGEIIQECLENYQKHGSDSITLCNRTLAHIKKLRYSSEASIIALEHLRGHIAEKHFDIVVIATASVTPLIQAQDLIHHKSRMIFLDLSVPRNTDKDIASLPGKEIILLDQMPIDNSLYEQDQEVPLAHAVQSFLIWLEKDMQRQKIAAQRRHFASTQQQLLSKALKKLEHGKNPHDVLQIFSHQLLQKLLHESSVTSKTDVLQ